MAAPIYDVTLFPAKLPRLLVPSTAGTIGIFVATVHADPGALRDWPNAAAVRAALKTQWRKSFDRAGQFWADKHNPDKPLTLTLYTTKGAIIGTLYATRKNSA